MSREYTSKILTMIADGELDPMTVVRAALDYMDEAEVKDMAISELGMEDDDDIEVEYDGQPDEQQEWHDFDPDC